MVYALMKERQPRFTRGFAFRIPLFLAVLVIVSGATAVESSSAPALSSSVPNRGLSSFTIKDSSPKKEARRLWGLPSNNRWNIKNQNNRQSSVSVTPPPTTKSSTRSLSSVTRGGCSPAAAAAAPESLGHLIRVGLAGGFGGAMGTAVLYPADCAKTLRQSNPDRYPSVTAALRSVVRHRNRAYAGLGPSVIGAIPSSALYFGAYEGMKRVLQNLYCQNQQQSNNNKQNAMDGPFPWWIHAGAAATGNVLSSAIFVPKEAIKQQMQYQQQSAAATAASVALSGNVGNGFRRACVTLVQERGVRGLYRGYQATLLRNIPSAMLRFVIYEQLKHRWTVSNSNSNNNNNDAALSWRLFLAGAAAGSLASGFMTPIDVIKTRINTGTCSIDLPGCAQQIWTQQGWRGFYLGAGSRMLWSGAFSSIGFGSFEAAKKWLGVVDEPMTTTTDVNSRQ